MQGYQAGGDPDKKTWYEDKYQVSTHTGNLAWVMIALLSYYEQKAAAEYLDAAIELGEWIYSKTYDTRGAGGYNGGYEGWEVTDENPEGTCKGSMEINRTQHRCLCRI